MWFISAGERVTVESELAWAGRLIERALGPIEPSVPPRDYRPTVHLKVEASRASFPVDGLRTITRGAWSDGRRTVLRNVGGSGFDLQLETESPQSADATLAVAARYRPAFPTRAANAVLADRFGLLAGQVLVHYPVLWRAGWRGRVPLHVAVVATSEGTALLAGPGGIGKSTVLVELLADGAFATADNLCCADVDRCFGLVEPLRLDRQLAGGGRDRTSHGRTSHGRVNQPLPARVAELTPDRLVVLERGPHTEIAPIAPDEAARTVVTGTYAAGELRRYWAFAATLALATGRGDAHPRIGETARAIAAKLPCLRVRVGDHASVSAADLSGVLA
jgi:hypothetical protein